MSIFEPSTEKLRVTLLVLPDSSMMSLASALDTMRAANRIASRTLFEWQLATQSGKAARLTCDLMIEPDVAFDEELRGDVLIVVASFHQQRHVGPAHLRLIKRLSRDYAAIGGIEGLGLVGQQRVHERRGEGHQRRQDVQEEHDVVTGLPVGGEHARHCRSAP